MLIPRRVLIRRAESCGLDVALGDETSGSEGTARPDSQSLGEAAVSTLRLNWRRGPTASCKSAPRPFHHSQSDAVEANMKLTPLPPRSALGHSRWELLQPVLLTRPARLKSCVPLAEHSSTSTRGTWPALQLQAESHDRRCHRVRGRPRAANSSRWRKKVRRSTARK